MHHNVLLDDDPTVAAEQREALDELFTIARRHGFVFAGAATDIERAHVVADLSAWLSRGYDIVGREKMEAVMPAIEAGFQDGVDAYGR